MRLFRYLLAALMAIVVLAFSPLRVRRVAMGVALAFVIIQLAAPHLHAANDGFDPSVSWSDWFWHYSGVAIQTVYGWFGYCMPDITGTKCANP